MHVSESLWLRRICTTATNVRIQERRHQLHHLRIGIFVCHHHFNAKKRIVLILTMKFAVAATLIASASAFSLSPQQVRVSMNFSSVGVRVGLCRRVADTWSLRFLRLTHKLDLPPFFSFSSPGCQGSRCRCCRRCGSHISCSCR